MTDVAEKVTVATEWKDSDGNDLADGDEVYVSVTVARGKWDFENDTYTEGRTFDFGQVESLNEDGTVSVWWDSAGCSCEAETGPSENPGDLTKLDPETGAEVREIAYLSNSAGRRAGREENQEELRHALGLPDPSNRNDN